MFVDIKSRLQESQLTELLSYSIFPDETRLIHIIKEYQSNSELEIYGFETEGELIGVLGIRMGEESTLHILHLSVHPNYRGLGYGRGQLMEMIALKKPEQLMAETDEDSVDFYRNVGFTVVSLGEKYPGVERFQCMYHTNEV
ncbi:MAG: GNAT family N-acetyltransferase [Paenibacillaceae bacterium]